MKKEVVICGRCKGVGELDNTTIHFDEVEIDTKPCPECKGEGRMVEVSWRKLLTLEEYEKRYKSIGEHSCQRRTSGV